MNVLNDPCGFAHYHDDINLEQVKSILILGYTGDLELKSRVIMSQIMPHLNVWADKDMNQLYWFRIEP